MSPSLVVAVLLVTSSDAVLVPGDAMPRLFVTVIGDAGAAERRAGAVSGEPTLRPAWGDPT